MANPWGDVGEQTARKIVRDNLWFWESGRCFTPEDLLSLAWSGQQPWLVKLEGKPLQALVRMAGLKPGQREEFWATHESASIGAQLTLFRLGYEGRLRLAIEIIRHPEVYGPVGDVLDLGWTKEGELDDWIEASATSWSAYQGVSRLRKLLIDYHRLIPDVLDKWDTELYTGARRRLTKDGRPNSTRYRNRAIVLTVYSLIASHSERTAGVKKLKKILVHRLVSEYLTLPLETVEDIWQNGKSFHDLWTLAPTLRPFVRISPELIPAFLEHASR